MNSPARRNPRLQDLILGSIDAKNDLLNPGSETAKAFEDSFVVPKDFDQKKFDDGRMQFIVGTKGTGKTALLRWLDKRQRHKGNRTQFVLFKSDILEEDRVRMSRAVDFTVVSQKDELQDLYQDFKYGWMIFTLKKIADIISKDDYFVSRDNERAREDYLKFMGYEYAGKRVLEGKWRGFLPPISGGKVRVSFNVDFFRAEFEGELAKADKIAEIPLGDFARRGLQRLCDLKFAGKRLLIFFDELEVFRIDDENHRRDMRMVRDLLFAVAELNRTFLASGVPIQLVAAVRSEVLADVQHVGEEIGRTVRDLGLKLDWYAGERSRDHPLIKIVQKKIRQSETIRYGTSTKDSMVWDQYFDDQVLGKSTVRFLLDASFMRPRDIIRRLTVCARLNPSESKFTANVLISSTQEYSAEMWAEIAEEMVPRYFAQEARALEQTFYGFRSEFRLVDFERRISERAAKDPHCRMLKERIGVTELLNDLFRLGVIGNIHVQDSRPKYTWYYGGRKTFDPYGVIVVHQSLWSHLALSRSRGKQADEKPRAVDGRRFTSAPKGTPRSRPVNPSRGRKV